MSRARKRADRIRKEISIVKVLSDYGYRVHPGGGDREQQFPCDLHGDGVDNMPSARVYPASDSWYCFACDITRDAIQTAREKEGLGFWDAIKVLEARYRLPALPWEPDDDVREPTAREQVERALVSDRPLEDVRNRVERLLKTVTLERSLPLPVLIALWEVYDRINYGVAKEDWKDHQAKQALARLRNATMEKLKACSPSPSPGNPSPNPTSPPTSSGGAPEP